MKQKKNKMNPTYSPPSDPTSDWTLADTPTPQYQLISQNKKIDPKGRISIKSAINHADISSTIYNIYTGDNGDILLKPMVSMPANEVWLYKNKAALNDLLEGIDQAKAGETVRLTDNMLAKDDEK